MACSPALGARAGMLRAAVVAGLLVAAGPALAQKMYRCGSIYQDRPCGGSDAGRVVGSAAPAEQAPSLSAACARRGEAVARIMWARESGRTEEAQLAAARGEADRDLIAQVYRERGNTADVRTRLEARCTADEERQRAAGWPVGAAAEPGAPSTARPSAPPAAAPPAPAQAGGAGGIGGDAAARKSTCDGLRSSREQVRSEQRTGGNASRMEALNQRMRELDQQMSAARC